MEVNAVAAYGDDGRKATAGIVKIQFIFLVLRRVIINKNGGGIGAQIRGFRHMVFKLGIVFIRQDPVGAFYNTEVRAFPMNAVLRGGIAHIFEPCALVPHFIELFLFVVPNAAAFGAGSRCAVGFPRRFGK